MLKRATRVGGVIWIFHRLAFAEHTRAPVEFHMRRGAPYILMDLAALDAVAALTPTPPDPGTGSRRDRVLG